MINIMIGMVFEALNKFKILAIYKSKIIDKQELNRTQVAGSFRISGNKNSDSQLQLLKVVAKKK